MAYENFGFGPSVPQLQLSSARVVLVFHHHSVCGWPLNLIKLGNTNQMGGELIITSHLIVLSVNLTNSITNSQVVYAEKDLQKKKK